MPVIGTLGRKYGRYQNLRVWADLVEIADGGTIVLDGLSKIKSITFTPLVSGTVAHFVWADSTSGATVVVRVYSFDGTTYAPVTTPIKVYVEAKGHS